MQFKYVVPPLGGVGLIKEYTAKFCAESTSHTSPGLKTYLLYAFFMLKRS